MAISEQWAELLEPGLREIFYAEGDRLATGSKIPVLFNQMTSQKAEEHFLGVGGMGDWHEYKGAIEYDDFDKLFKTTLTHKEYVNGFKVERKLVDDDQYGIINARPRGLSLGYYRTREKHAASIFNNAFTSGTGGDGVYLCASTHDYSPANGAHQSNVGVLTLSYDNLIATRALMQAFEDDRGELMTIEPDTLLVPPGLEQTAFEIFRTINNKPNTADTVVNFVTSWLRNVIVWPALTTSNHWFLIDSALAKQHLLWIDRVPVEFALDPTSDFRLEARYRGYARYSYGWSDYRWCYGNNP